MNRGVEISADVADGVGGIRAAIEDQITNGVAVRMACLYLLMGQESASVIDNVLCYTSGMNGGITLCPR